MATLQSRLQKLSQKHGTARPTSVQSRLQRLSRLHGTKKEEEDEERGLLSRVWYGEEEGEGGRMGIEDIPGQFADVALSPIEKGLKPLIDLGAGAGKIAIGQEEDEDTRLARMAGSEMVESVTGLPKAFESGYPVEGVMNLAAAATLPFTGGASVAGLAGKVPKLGQLAKVASKLDKIAGHKAMRVADVVADPMSYGIGKAAKGVVATGRAAKRAVTGDKGGAGGPDTGDATTFKEARADIPKPGRKWIQEVAEFGQSFTTGIAKAGVGRLYDYLSDPTKRQRHYKTMMEARNNPNDAIKAVVTKIQNRIQQMRDTESPAYSAAKKKYQGSKGIAGKTIETDFRAKGGDIIGDEVDKLLGPSAADTGFGGQLVIKWKEKTGVDKDGIDLFRDVETPWADRNTIPDDEPYRYDIKWERGGIESELPGNQQAAYRKELLNNVLQSSRGLTSGNAPISFNNILARSKKFESELGTYSAKMDMGPTDKFRSRLKAARRQIVQDAAGEDAAKAFSDAEDAYSQHKIKLDQMEEDFGSKIGDKDVDYKQQRSKLYGDVMDSVDRLDELEDIVGGDGMAQLLGAAHSSSFGGGLTVRANWSALLAKAGTAGLAFAAGTAAVGGLPGTLLGAVGSYQLMKLFSPQAMLPLSNYLAQKPSLQRIVRGSGGKSKIEGGARAVIDVVKGAEKLLGKQGISLRKLAQQGMTFGQLMQRLEGEAEREQRQR